MIYMENTTSKHNSIDLHVHSCYSDGSAPPAKIVRQAAALGLRMIAITDHDTVDGIGEALMAADEIKQPFMLIPGVEISADYEKPLHILGYFQPKNYLAINPFLIDMKIERHIRNQGIIAKLNNLGIRITEDDVSKVAGKALFGRPHIAAALIEKGVVSNQKSAFNEYLSSGRKAYVRKRSRPPAECVAAIAAAGGLPVIAHPSQIGIKLGEVEALAMTLIGSGLFGIETYYPEHTPTETANYLELTQKLGLFATGGSDYHGAYREKIKLGAGKDNNLYVPDTVSDIIISTLGIHADQVECT